MENCCFIGHRFLAKKKRPIIKKRLKATIEELIQQGVTSFICGGSFGFGLLAGCIVWGFKEKYEDIHLTMLLPCQNQPQKWEQKDQEKYARLLVAADEIIYVSEDFFEGCMNLRNMRMLEVSQYLVAYLKETEPLVRVAKEMGLTVINLADSGV